MSNANQRNRYIRVKRHQHSIDKLCAWRHNMPRPSPPPWAPRRPSASRVAEQTQRSSTFPRRIRSHADHCSRLTR